ncbi:hypothetical protein [Asticcacaulis solisilvae]|uniref:hypothetical protein n=1 Tax=Asticcacaulis solisilvae TaxID=1217274 RepID=UPI003FD77DDF
MVAKAPLNMRNGLKWRDGRPRWEPSPANRAIGISGFDIKGLDGQWIADRGQAISIADLRHEWAATYRTALLDNARGAEARLTLAEALVKLPQPQTDDARASRRAITDILEKSQALIECRPEVTLRRTGGRSVADLIDAYFVAQQSPDNHRRLAPATIELYRKQSRRLRDRFGRHSVHEIDRPMVHQWYSEVLKATSVATAHSTLAVTAAIFRWGTRHAGWNKESPATHLGLEKPKGRTVSIPFATEKAFVRFCDANSFEDVADAVTLGCWTAASQVDMVKATIGTLSQSTWRYRRQKTGVEAITTMMPAVQARIQRRRADVINDGAEYASTEAAPFLCYADKRTGTRVKQPHTSRSIGDRFQEARRAALAAVKNGTWPELAELSRYQLRDTRDTCVTRLFMAGVSMEKIPPWTGHSQKEAERILRDHYIELLEEGAHETARILLDYADAQAIELATDGG